MTELWRNFAVGLRSRIKDVVIDHAERPFLPYPRRDDDLFLVEFPKSGVTWLTFLVANCNLLLSGDEREATFFNVNDFVPDVENLRHLPGLPLSVPGYRCFKSHSPVTQRYRKVIYLVRDPRHVMVSFHAFLNGVGWWNGSIKEMIGHPRYGIRAWVKHVSGWLDHVHAGTAFNLSRYEDLVDDTAGEIRRIYRMLGWTLSDKLVMEAVARSSAERMREDEAQFNAGHPALKNVQFVRKGKIGGPREEMPEDVRRRIEDEAGPLMARLGYPSGQATPSSAPEAPRETGA